MTRGRLFVAVGALAVALFLAWSGLRSASVAPAPAPEPRADEPPPLAPFPSERAPAGVEDPVTDSVTLVGRVLDQDGAPFADLAVAAGTRRARTNAEGDFELDGLARAELALDLTADFDPAQPLGTRRLATALAPLALDLRRGPARVDAGTHVVPRSRPFWVHGRVELDPEWARSAGVSLADVRIEPETPPPEELGELMPAERTRVPGEPTDWTRPPWRAELPRSPEVAPDGTFRFALETPHDPFRLRVRVRRFEPILRIVVPLPGDEFRATFRFP